MKTVEGIASYVMREFCGLPYSGHHGELMRLYAEFEHGILKRLQDCEVTASGTPGRYLSLIIF
jgi:hypothetical protein